MSTAGEIWPIYLGRPESSVLLSFIWFLPSQYGCGSKPMVPFWDSFSLVWWGLGCSLGVRGFDPWPYRRIHYLLSPSCLDVKQNQEKVVLGGRPSRDPISRPQKYLLRHKNVWDTTFAENQWKIRIYAFVLTTGAAGRPAPPLRAGHFGRPRPPGQRLRLAAAAQGEPAVAPAGPAPTTERLG